MNDDKLKITDYFLYGNDGNFYSLSMDEGLKTVNVENVGYLTIIAANDNTIIYYSDDRTLKQDGKLYRYNIENSIWEVDTKFDFDDEKIIEYSFDIFNYIKINKVYYTKQKINKE